MNIIFTKNLTIEDFYPKDENPLKEISDTIIQDETRKKYGEEFKEKIFLADSRNYSEEFIEPIIRKLYSLMESTDNSHDTDSTDGERGEVKASKVLKPPTPAKKTKTNTENLPTNRIVSFDDCYTQKYGSNIQNIKRDHFDVMYYVLLFSEWIKIFSMKKEEIEFAPSWCPKHGRCDAYGKNGQMMIHSKNIQWHLDHHLIGSIDWSEAADIYYRS